MLRRWKPLFLVIALVMVAASRAPASILAAAATAPGPGANAAQAAAISLPSGCQPLPPPTGTTVSVANVTQLENVVNNAVAGTTVLVQDGTYNLNGGYLRVAAPNVTLRSASGNPGGVVIDGGYVTTEIVQVVASNVTMAELTLKRAYNHPIHVMSSDTSDTLNTQIYRVQVFDAGQQAIKINPAGAGFYTDYGTVACSHIELTDAGRPNIRDSCYTGGIDGHQSRGWLIRDNWIGGFWCAAGLSEHGIHFWTGSRDTTIERNTLVNNARGIGCGLLDTGTGRTYADNACPTATGYVDHYGATIRNNVIFVNRPELFASASGFDCGICIAQTCGATVVHNTVFSTQAPFSSIEWRFGNTIVDVRNNLVSHNLRDRGGASTQAGNLQNAAASLFVSAATGDLHLAATAGAAIDKGAAVAPGKADDDIDRESRPAVGRDIGADEFGRSAKPRNEVLAPIGPPSATALAPVVVPAPVRRMPWRWRWHFGR